MQNIIAALTAAIAFVFSSRATIAALKQQIADRDKIIDELHAAVVADQADDASLEQAATDAKAAQKKAEDALAEINGQIESGNTKADELAAAITADPEIPISVNADGTVAAAA